MSVTRPTEAEIITAQCKMLHHKFDGPVVEKIVDGVRRRVAFLECINCGTQRTDHLTPTYEEFLWREYNYDAAPNYIRDMSWLDARKIWYRAKFTKEVKAA